jgi:DNA-binding CsgD family transcriptional regulator
MSDTTSGDAPARPGGPGGPAVPEPVPGLLQETECLRLISTGGIGRLAYSRPDGLAVLPVNYDRLPGLRIGCARSPTSSSPVPPRGLDSPWLGLSVDKWPLAGRDEELSRLSAAVVARRGAVITGPAGVGKTTLARTGLRVAEQRGMSVAQTAATWASRGLPFGALAAILPPDPHAAGLAREDLGELLRRYGRAVAGRAKGQPLVVFVDDAHLLDGGSATLVHQLALTQAATVLVTVRSGEAAPDPVVALWKDGPAERIELGVLDDVAIEELLVKVLEGPVDAAAVRQLADHSRGNPMALRELVIGALDSGALAADGGLWRLRGGLRPTARLVELVALRLADLSEAERAVLELAAVGEPLGQDELAQLADLAAVECLERKGLLTSRMDGRRIQVGLAHPVYGDVVRAGISALRERGIARSLAEVIEAAGGRRREDTLRLASLRLAGGGGSAGLLAAGALAARARHDRALAERLARAAIAEGAGFDARFVAAEAAHSLGRPAQAERELASLAADAAGDADRARVALLRFDDTYYLQGRDAALRLIDEAADAVTDPYWRDELLSRRSFVRSLNRGPRAAVEAAPPTLLQPSGSRPLTSGAHAEVFYGLARLGRLDEAIQLLSPADGTAIPAPDEPWQRWTPFAVLVAGLVWAGRLGDAEELLTRAHGLVMGQPAAEASAFVAGRFAVLHLEQGRPMSAFRRASESYTRLKQLGRPLVARLDYVTAAHALALVGRAGQAAETLSAFDALDLPAFLLDETDHLQARAWAAAAAGDLPAAREQLAVAADLGEQVGDLIGAAGALHDLARLGHARDVAARLAALATQVDGDLVAARAGYASAVASGDSETLKRVCGDFEDMGTILYAAEASAEAAVLLRRAGNARAAAAAEQKAARLLARCEGAATPPVRAIGARVRLTPGELDTAVQAAAGHSNKQIAGHLHVSVRTVESHLQRAYEKLGISGRHELADALDHQPDP